ncbi:MAG: hypothetical protein DLM57_12410, partial [Pseudonocardiales bacterium]
TGPSASAPTSGPAAGGGASGTGPSAAFCSLVTLDEARAALGGPVKPGLDRATRSSPFPGGGSCLYNGTTSVIGASYVVNVIVLGTKIPRSVYDSEFKGNPDAGPITPVPGLGEDAFSVPGVVSVFDHGLVMALEIVKNSRPADIAVIVGLLRKALARAGGLR